MKRRFVIGIVLVLAGVVSGLMHLPMFRWNRTSGVIDLAEVNASWNSSRGIEGGTTLRYSYEAGNARYSGSRVDFLRTGAIRLIAGQFSRGDQVTVYYDPANPADAVLDRTSAFLPLVVAVAGGAMLAWARFRP